MTASATASTPLAAGAVAPDFSLASTGGKEVSLSEVRSRSSVLIAFFPLAFTGVCTTEMCAFTEDFEQFSALDVTVLPISVDSVPSLKEFRGKENISLDLLSDFKRDASRAYGVLREDTFFSNRAYFLVGQDGVIRWAHVEATPGDRRENAELLQAIAAHLG